MKIKVSSVNIEPNTGFTQILEFEPINYLGTEKFVKEVDHSEILELIPVDEIIEYLQNQGINELI